MTLTELQGDRQIAGLLRIVNGRTGNYDEWNV
jgi:hypothetical protein